MSRFLEDKEKLRDYSRLKGLEDTQETTCKYIILYLILLKPKIF